MKQKELKKMAKKLILAGKSHQETLDELLTLTKLPAEDIAKTIKYIPTLNTRRVNKVANTSLLIIICLTIIFKITYGISLFDSMGLWSILLIFILPILNIWFLIGVAKYETPIYKLVAIFTLIGIANNIDNILGASLDIYMIIDLIIAGSLIGLSFHLNSKMTAEYQVNNQRYVNESGQTRLKKTVRFLE